MEIYRKHAVNPAQCTHCGVTHDAASQVALSDAENSSAPRAGDLTICIACGHLMCFTDDQQLRDLTKDELRECADDLRITAIRWGLQRLGDD